MSKNIKNGIILGEDETNLRQLSIWLSGGGPPEEAIG